MPLLARIFLVQTVLFFVFIQENRAKIKAIGKDSSSRKEKKKGKICWKIKVFGKDRSNLAKGLWSRSLLRQKRRPWSSFPMTQGLQNYYIAWFIQLRKDKENCPEEDKSFLLKQKFIIPTRLRVLSHSYFSPYFGLISVRFRSFCFVFLCILCVLSPFGTVLVSKFGINFQKNRRRKTSLFFFSKWYLALSFSSTGFDVWIQR